MATVTDRQLIEAALAARKHAYGQYSNYRVGCALVDEHGRIHIGCNVENETYPEGTCAEAGAVAAMAVSTKSNSQLLLATNMAEATS